MPIWFSDLLILTGLTLMILAAVLFVFKKHLPGIPNLFFEATGLFMICLVFGRQKIFFFLPLLVLSFVIAAVLDPFWWKKQGYDFSRKKSWLLNMSLAGIGTTGFLIGYLF